MSKLALVTGSTRGIGKQIALDLLYRGSEVIFNYAKDAVEADKLHQDLFDRGLGGRFIILQADMSNINSADLIDKALEEAKLDYIVFNAGMTLRKPFGELTYEETLEVFNLNTLVPLFILQNIKDRIKDGGKIVFITSIAGMTSDSVSIPYGVSKGATNIMIPYLAKEFASRNITVNAVAPGYIMTDWHANKDDAQIKRISDKTMLKRFGTPEEVSKAVLSLLDNDYITGQVLRVDGGFHAC